MARHGTPLAVEIPFHLHGHIHFKRLGHEMLRDLFDLKNWVTMPLKGLVFPRKCGRCDGETGESIELSGQPGTSVAGVLGLFVGLERAVVLKVPFCSRCRKDFRRRRYIWALAGLIGGIGLGIVVAGAMAPSGGTWAAMTPEVWKALAVGTGILFGAAAGYARGGLQTPVRLRRFSKAEGTVEMWFERPRYREEVKQLNGVE